MEVSVFPEPAVAAAKREYVEARLHSDAHDPVLLERVTELIETVARTPAQPTYVIVEPTSEIELGRWNGAIRSNEEFVDFLQDATTKVASN